MLTGLDNRPWYNFILGTFLMDTWCIIHLRLICTMVQSLWFKISFQNFSISTTGYEEPGYRLHFVCTSNFLYLAVYNHGFGQKITKNLKRFKVLVIWFRWNLLDTHDSLLIAINHDGHLFSENISNQLVRNSIRSVSEKNLFRGNLSRVFLILEILNSYTSEVSYLMLTIDSTIKIFISWS